MRIAILHPSLNMIGGAEKLALSMIEALTEFGFEVTLCTVEPLDNTIKRTLLNLGVQEYSSIFPVKIKGFSLYLRQALSICSLKTRKEFDLTINTHGDLMPVNADITYMHFPMMALILNKYSKYMRNLSSKVYFIPYYLIQKKLSKRINTILLTNSKFSLAHIHMLLHRKAFVLYPPVDLYFHSADEVCNNNIVRKPVIISIGRYSQEKLYEHIVEVARKLQHYEFIIIGSIYSLSSIRYYEKLKEIIEKNNISNVTLYRNVKLHEIKEILSQASVYFHPMVGEHFGIAVVEAMNAGLVPVVHKYGGPWTDIINYGTYGYGYMNLDEAARAIQHAIKMQPKLCKAVHSRSTYFSKEMFKKRIRKLIHVIVEKLIKLTT